MKTWFFLIILSYFVQSQECDDYSSEIMALQTRVEFLEGWEEYATLCYESVQNLTGCHREITTPETEAQIEAWDNAVKNGALECSFVPEEFRDIVCPAPSTSPSPFPTQVCQDTLSASECQQIKDLDLCHAFAKLDSTNTSCALTCGTCCESVQFTNCLTEYVAYCISAGVDNAINCLSQIPSDDVSFCCQEYVSSEIPNICEHLIIEGSIYDGMYSLAGKRNGRDYWSKGEAEIYFSEDLDLGPRWLFVSDLSNYYLVLSDLMRPPSGESWVHSSSSAATISITCTANSASPTRTPSFDPSRSPVPPPSEAPFGLSDYGDIPTCCKMSASTPRGSVNLVKDQERMKNGQVYWKSSDPVSLAEIYWSEGLAGNRWVFSGLQDFGYWGFTPLYLDFMGTSTWEYHDYTHGFDNIVPMEETVTITCTSETCDDTYNELCELCSSTCPN